MPWPADTAVYEIDQPKVIEFKTRTLKDLGAEPAAQRHPVAIDLRDDWPSALQEAGFNTGRPTAWIAEGLLVYLPPEAQDRLFDNISALSAPGSRIATEHMDLGGIPSDWAQKLTERSRRIGSNIDLAELFYTGERNAAAAYLAGHGWRVHVPQYRRGLRRTWIRGPRRRVGLVRRRIGIPDGDLDLAAVRRQTAGRV